MAMASSTGRRAAAVAPEWPTTSATRVDMATQGRNARGTREPRARPAGRPVWFSGGSGENRPRFASPRWIRRIGDVQRWTCAGRAGSTRTMHPPSSLLRPDLRYSRRRARWRQPSRVAKRRPAAFLFPAKLFARIALRGRAPDESLYSELWELVWTQHAG